MGTRNLTCVLSDGKIQLAQYCQWDGYPTGQGETIAAFITNEYDKRKFKKQLAKIQFINEADYKAAWSECGADPESDTVSVAVSEKFKKKYAHLSRDCGADVLSYILNTDQPRLHKAMSMEVDFAADSLMCEWVYVVNLDTNKLEIFKGFNKEPLKRGARFFRLQKLARDGYYPVKLWKNIPFKNLSKDLMAELEQEDRNEQDAAV